MNLTQLATIRTIQPMYILTRYVVLEVVKYFLAALVSLTLVVTPVMAVKEGLGRGVPASIMLAIMPFTLPEMFGITIPASILFSVCSVFGRMTGANEVVAIKSLGISPMAIVWPVIVLATFLSLGTVCMYEIAATWCKPKVLQTITESVEDIAYSMLQKNRSYSGDMFTITVKRVDKPTKHGERPRLISPTITIIGPPRVTIQADEATLKTNWDTHTLEVKCVRGEFDIGGRGRLSFPDEQSFSVPIPTPSPPHDHRDWVATRNIPTLIGELQASLAQRQNELRTLLQRRDESKSRGLPEPPELAQQIAGTTDGINDCNFKICRLKTEPYRRWANGFTCLCFALIGIPVAMIWRHADVLTNFFVCFLPILVIYYPLLMLSDDLSTSGKLPPFSFWIANVALAIPAIALLRQMVRH